MQRDLKEEVPVEVPSELYLRPGRMIADTVFSGVNEFIVFMMGCIAPSGCVRGKERLTLYGVGALGGRPKRGSYLKEGG